MRRPLTVVQATALLRKHEYTNIDHIPSKLSVEDVEAKDAVDEFWFQDL
jgi:hypothetical protein